MLAPTRKISVTDLPCPGRPPEPYGTHRLITDGNSLICSFCQRTEEQIQNGSPLMHKGYPCACVECQKTGVMGTRCTTCHLSMDVHVRT